MIWKQEKEKLEKFINDDYSYEEIGRIYGCTGTNIKKVAIRLGIELKQKRKINKSEHFNRGTRRAKYGVCEYCGKEFPLYENSGGKYCCHKCWASATKEKTIKEWETGESNGCDKRYRLSPTIKEYIIKERGCKCEKCGFSGFNPYTKKTILQIHHKDGDATNTNVENLEVLCPNCHAMTENFGSRNKNSKREYRKEEYRKQEGGMPS